MLHNPLEILAPAGNEEMLRAAVFSGADCVYLGIGNTSARQGANTFTPEELIAAVGFCHARNCKVYAAINTLVTAGNTASLEESVQAAVNACCDAVIVQDLYTARLIKTLAPEMPLHASTQMSIHSLAGVQQMAEWGFARVILSRELTLAEISYIAQNSSIELEVFVHGALCVSVSGQCFMSAFLGGRSGNHGSCAGPCRLPFSAKTGGAWEDDLPQNEKSAPKLTPATQTFHLSLRDLSILDALPELQKAGVVSAKIEGRLRGPEYCAFVVDCARKAREGKPYDKSTLQDIFSRKGFTDGWFTGNRNKDMFGARSEADRQIAKAASAKARELYRREAPRVPLGAELLLYKEEGTLTITDGVHKVTRVLQGPFPPSEKEIGPSLATSLSKTGGTPFYMEEERIRVEANHFFVPASAIGALRREMLEELLTLRETDRYSPKAQFEESNAPSISPLLIKANSFSQPAISSSFKPSGIPKKRPALRGRFETVARMPQEAAHLCEELLLPLWEAEDVPPELRGKTRLWLPRLLLGNRETEAEARILKTSQMGFLGYEAQNMAHLKLCKGLPVGTGFGMNLTNPVSAGMIASWGYSPLTLSPELTLRQMGFIAHSQELPSHTQLDALCYGHLPLMITRACPLRNTTDCAHCPKNGILIDRKGAAFKVLCRNGTRSIFNPVPLWMADRLEDLPTQYATLYFTTENKSTAANVLADFHAGKPATGPFTRGLYDKGVT